MVFSKKRRDQNKTTFFYTLVIFLQFLMILILYKQHREENHYDLENADLKKMRHSALNSIPTVQDRILELSKLNDSQQFFKSIQIESFCPAKVRVGGEGDSGKVTCDPRRAKVGCTMMSLGLNDQIEFDEELQEITENRCKIIGADMREQNSATQEKYSKMRGHLFVGSIPDTLKLFRMMIDSGSKEIEILKMDIESSEHDALEPFLKSYFVCQILVEIHGKPARQLEMLRKISRQGFRLFNLEPNPLCSVCCEYSFINEMCMARYQVTPLAAIIPAWIDN
uniref:Methyltranfer_dom domain-containing protein n=1 Tax=Caenorhabditis japonica TaxID=281687 RepID=A0A8R1IKF8_CAEJA